MCSEMDISKNVNSRINLIFVGAFHPKKHKSNHTFYWTAHNFYATSYRGVFTIPAEPSDYFLTKHNS